MKIAITGHRPNKLGNDYDLVSPLIQAIKKQILIILSAKGSEAWSGDETEGIKDSITLITGMALGIDTLFAKIAIENNIPFIAAIPCRGQDSKWMHKSRRLYADLINHPLCIQHVNDIPYNDQCMQIRNKWMVDNCDLLIAVWDGSSGGTANCVAYAKSKNKDIYYINPKELNL